MQMPAVFFAAPSDLATRHSTLSHAHGDPRRSPGINYFRLS
jgi:hypothetical protein